MLTYVPPEQRPAPPTYERPWLLLLLAFVWLWPGVFAHDLWQDEISVYAVIRQAAEGGQWWLPQDGGTLFWDVPPLYMWLSLLFLKLFGHLPPYEAVRMVNALLAAVSLAAMGGAGRMLLGRRNGRTAVLVLIGCPGLLMMSHFIGGQIVTLCGLSLSFYALAMARQKTVKAIVLTLLGWTVLSLSGSLLPLLGVMLTSALLLLDSHWHNKRFWLTLLAAAGLTLPLLFVWPLVLNGLSHEAFLQWWRHHALAPFGGFARLDFGFSAAYYLKNLLWFALPAWPLAAWTLSRTRIHDKNWGILSLSWLVIMTALLAINPQRLQDNLVWLLPPLALLGAAQLDGLRRGAAAFINWFGIMAFGLIAVFLWLGFFAMNYGWPAKLAERAAYFSPYYILDIDPIPMAVALLFTPLWLWAITRKNIRGRQAVTNWAAGVTLAWALLMTLFLPWLNAAKSHAPVVHQMEAALSSELKQQLSDGLECISIDSQDQRTRIAWTQYSHIKTTTDNPTCRYHLIRQAANIGVPSGWQTLWQGARPRNKAETFLFLEKTSAQ